jgi:preprotein translocase subunit SecD
VIWKAEDLEKAFQGDPVLKPKLESDLNVRMDGTPLPTLKISSLENGIILDYPVSLHVSVNGTVKTVSGRVEEPYQTRFSMDVQAQYKDKQVNTATILGYYATEAKRALTDKALKENVQKSIESKLSKENAQQLAVAPEKVLQSAQVVVNEKYITGATHRGYDTPRGKMYDLTIELNDEGRRRLWKYSQDKVGTHLLLVTDGIPIAAPIIRNELSQGELTITQMQDEGLVKDAEDALNRGAKGESAH